MRLKPEDGASFLLPHLEWTHRFFRTYPPIRSAELACQPDAVLHAQTAKTTFAVVLDRYGPLKGVCVFALLNGH